MKRTRPSLDGFVSRHEAPELGKQHRAISDADAPRRQRLHTGAEAGRDIAQASQRSTLGISGVRESLSSIDAEEPKKPAASRERRRARKERRKHSKRRRVIKWVALIIVVAVLGIAAYVGIKGLIASNNIFEGGILGLAQRQPLKQDENGRSNFVVFGTAEDNEGGTHDGATLTDSIMVLSVNQEKKDAYMVSIPRDLWVEYGQACISGYQGKINEVYSCGSNSGEDEPAGAAALRQKISSILGLDIHYYIHLNFTAVVEAVDAVGGVEVKIESNPKGMGILDRNFDWKCGYQCHFVKYEDGQVAQLDGEHALALARARNAQGGYGLAAGNFDREKNQQKIIKALREKALSAGTLTNLGKVTGLIDALGNNLRTNIETKEIQTIMSLASEIESDNIRSLTLVNEEAPLVTTGMVGAASVVQPVAGLFAYDGIKAYIMKNSSSNPVVREAAKVVVLNGTSVVGLAQTEADVLTQKGYTISAVDNAPEGEYASIEIYRIGDDYSATASALAAQYGVELKRTAPPLPVMGDVSFVVVVGQERQQ